jgi:hypothetical protein
MILKKLSGLVLLACAFGLEGAIAQQDPAPFTTQKAMQSATDAPVAGVEEPGASPSPTVSPVYHDALGRVVVEGNKQGVYGLRYDGLSLNFSELVDGFGNRTRVSAAKPGLPVELKHEFNQRPPWYERFSYDAADGVFLSGVDQGESLLGTRAAQFGVQVGFPDWVQVTFGRGTTINQVDVVTLQDSIVGRRPLRASEAGGPTRFSAYGITDYEVQYQDAAGKWVMIAGAYVTNNRDVARTFIFKPITTKAIRLIVKGGLAGYSRVVEVEAFEESTHRNVALASQGGVATASSSQSSGGYPASGVINGDETGAGWGSGGAWNDNTIDTPPTAGTVQTVDLGSNYVQTTFSNQFGRVVRTANNNPVPTTIPHYSSFMLERAEVNYTGHTFTGTVYLTSKGMEYWDSSGGSRIQYYNGNKQMYYVSDWMQDYGTRPVVRINRDAQGRPTDVYLGDDVGLVQFVYDANGWVYTRLIDRTTNTTYRHTLRRDKTPQSLSYPELLHVTTGYMPKYGPIMEWHDAISPVPNAVVSLKGMPYALMPTVQTGFVQPARWVITPFAGEQEPMVDIRIEYDATAIYLYLPTLDSGSMIMGRDMQAYHFGRRMGTSTASSGVQSEEATLRGNAAPDYGSVFKAILLGDWKSLVAIAGHRNQAGEGWTRSPPARLDVSNSSPVEISDFEHGRGGSGGGSEGEPIGAENDQVPPDGYSETINVTAHGDVFDSTAWTFFLLGGTPPNPAATGAPSDPPDPYQPNADTNSCAGPGTHPANTTASAAGFNTNTGCPPRDPPHEDVACAPIELQPDSSLLKQQMNWARGVASQAMKDSKCSKFLHDPSSGGYLYNAGYRGNQAHLDPLLSQPGFQDRWDNSAYMDGSGSSLCSGSLGSDGTPCGAAAWTEPNDPTVFLCPSAWQHYASQPGTQGSTMLALYLLHEFLHDIGLQESLDVGGPFPTSNQINSAMIKACGQAAADAGRNEIAPH